MTNTKLNKLLSDAKQSQQSFDAEGAYSRSPMWRITRGRADVAWNLLYEAILENEPCTVLMSGGESRTICTVGALASDLMLYYSPSTNAKNTMHGVDLRSIESIEIMEKVEEQL